MKSSHSLMNIYKLKSLHFVLLPYFHQSAEGLQCGDKSHQGSGICSALPSAGPLMRQLVNISLLLSLTPPREMRPNHRLWTGKPNRLPDWHSRSNEIFVFQHFFHASLHPQGILNINAHQILPNGTLREMGQIMLF